MAEFLNPFQGILPNRTLSLGELIRAIRQNIAAEEEATHLYTAQAEATDNELAKRVLLEIADEERVHVGEFSRLLSIITEGEEDRFLAQGAQEVDEIAGEGQVPAGEKSGSAMTVGSLKG